LYQPAGGKGLLLGGLPGAERGRVVIIGAGNAGGNAAAMAAAMGAEVTVFDLRRERLVAMRRLGNNVSALYPYRDAVKQAVAGADLLIGAVLRTGDRSPHVVTRSMVAAMTAGSVIVDISVDQGGCIETTRPTTYESPTYFEEGVLHFTVTNMPGAVPRSATQALSAALLPYVHCLTGDDWRGSRPLVRGINIEAGQLVHPALKESLA
jgi:alanine dehydrogenase